MGLMSLSWRRMYYNLGISYVYTINLFVVKSKDIKIVFIIGNGFDLDLGWKTQFSQFASSSHWPSIPSFVSPMYETLNENRQKSLWFDLEYFHD